MNEYNLNIIIHSEFIDKIHYGLTLATASRALDNKVTLFFAMKSIYALAEKRKKYGWTELKTENGTSAIIFDTNLKNKNIANFEELIKICNDFEISFMVCEMGMKYLNLNYSDLRKDIKYLDGGLVTIFENSGNNNSFLFI
ncbi:MAG: hypothetical protein CFH01_01576 [Alphaproteobacteria bacterium MarineAlpha2_Bin1]|nr:MAG: hypothetical protein CFH01_01576 [Alphaproteobacteria bacterium MarineAlpha2_Bin1]